MSVPARISIVTLGVDDLARSKAFYQALGWELADEEGDEIAGSRRPTPTSACSAVKTSRRTQASVRAEGGVRWDRC